MRPSAAYPALAVPPPSRSPWQWLYESAHRWRYRWYRRRAKRLPKPVVSVGNLHWGGGGKTPVVAAVAAHLRDAGWRVAILSRGYKSQGHGVRLVSRGEGPLLGPMIAGDEPVLLAGLLPSVAVVVCPDRHHAGVHALARLDPAPDLFLLDDGFSHLQLHRDVDLLVFPAADPFGGGRLPPAGRLREPLTAARRAHAVLLTGADIAAGSGDRLARALRLYGYRGPGFSAPLLCDAPRKVLDGAAVATGERALLVSAIARPEPFAAAARHLATRSPEFEIAGELRFPDHHPYPAASLEKIARTYRDTEASLVLVTAKDRVKLQGRLELPLAEIPIRSEPESGFLAWLEERLDNVPARPS